MADNNKTQSGFALLISLIVVGAVLSIGLVIIDLSIKQVRLASTTKDSEIAFHAANAGIECARFWRRQASTTLTAGDATNNIECFGQSVNLPVTAPLTSGAGGEAFLYEYEFTWNAGQSCTSIKKVVAVSAINGSVTVNNMQTHIPGYPDGNTLVCPVASECTIVSSQGYNRECSQKEGFGSIRREVLLEF